MKEKNNINKNINNDIDNTINDKSINKENTVESLLDELNDTKYNYECLATENQQIIEELEQKNNQIEKLQKTVDRLQSSADNSDKFRDQLVSMKADFDSYKRRMRNDAEENVKAGQRNVLEMLIPVLDNFEIAKSHLDGDNLKAFEMILVQFERVLREMGVEEINPLGQHFDVVTMNALSSMDRGEQNTDKVVEVYKKGYMLDGKVVRYAEVIVGS